MAADDGVPVAWRSILKDVLGTPESRRLSAFLQAEEQAGKRIFPPRGERLTALALTHLDKVKVVVLGQDPYHGAGQAHGLAFSVRRGVRVPPSLANIYKELRQDLDIPVPAHGNLTSWAEQGVLLLNNVLTVEEGRAGSHQNIGWEAITDVVVAAVARQALPCVFLLWGSHAQKKVSRLTNLQYGPHLVLTAPHPSPLSAHRGFLGCGHFGQTNAFLAAHQRGAVDWRLPE